MAKQNKIDTKPKRDKLAARREPYWEKVQAGAYIGFRRSPTSGTWIARFRHGDGKQSYSALTLPDHLPPNEYDAAVTKAREWFSNLLTDSRPKAYTIATAVEDYLTHLGLHKSEKAMLDAKARADRCILPKFGTLRVDQITTEQIRDWLNGLIPAGADEDKKRKAKATANRNLTTLKAILNFAVEHDHAGSPTTWSRVKSFKNVEGPRKEYLTRDQLAALIDHTNGAFKTLVIAAALTGARYGELCALQVRDVDVANGDLHIREGKTGPRHVPLTDEMALFFGRVSAGKKPSDYLLTRENGQDWRHSDQDGPMKIAAKAAGLHEDVVFYTLRHSFIALAISSGLDLYSVAKIAGTSVRMIEKHYGKLFKNEVKLAMARASLVSII